MAIDIRSMTPDDFPWVIALNQQHVPAVSDAEGERFSYLFERSAIALTAWVDEVRAGFSLTMTHGLKYDSTNYQWFSDNYGNFIYLDRVVVDESFHRHGIGRALYLETERRGVKHVPDAEIFGLEVNVEPRNDVSLAFHQRLGFYELVQRPTPYGIVVAMMGKPLTPKA
ncbi:MAG: GNAT family N-acetyltransferase [Acidimicrobiaceae bacterium]|nr:GNAT family N-acetyltransferase [Acidimicrobiaceae bacterium]HBU74925.1 GNAT family N-acetyltransferase [Acidimicrobiaceae bacterium]|tara:strand:+ start:2539 stop:3045 length:507 start_codon:yes stop_codon:yes gene_type:complete